jgi:hypothetical protein
VQNLHGENSIERIVKIGAGRPGEIQKIAGLVIERQENLSLLRLGMSRKPIGGKTFSRGRGGGFFFLHADPLTLFSSKIIRQLLLEGKP